MTDTTFVPASSRRPLIETFRTARAAWRALDDRRIAYALTLRSLGSLDAPALSREGLTPGGLRAEAARRAFGN